MIEEVFWDVKNLDAPIDDTLQSYRDGLQAATGENNFDLSETTIDSENRPSHAVVFSLQDGDRHHFLKSSRHGQVELYPLVKWLHKAIGWDPDGEAGADDYAPVFVHCVSGGCRSVTAALVYLHCVMQVSVAEVLRYVHMMRWVKNVRGEFLEDIERAAEDIKEARVKLCAECGAASVDFAEKFLKEWFLFVERKIAEREILKVEHALLDKKPDLEMGVRLSEYKFRTYDDMMKKKMSVLKKAVDDEKDF